jgi:hypothetical protein
MEGYGKILIVAGICAVVLGALVVLLSRLGIPKIPGDILIRHGDFVFYSPLGLSLMLSMFMTVLLSLLSRK